MENKVKVLKNGTVFGDLKIGDCFIYNYNGAEYTLVYMKIKSVIDDDTVVNAIVLNEGCFSSWSDKEPVALVDITIEARM